MPITKGMPIEPFGRNLYSKNPRTQPKIKQVKQKQTTTKELKKYTVWVGGTEVTDVFVKYSIAKEILKQYTALGYDDVKIQEGRNDRSNEGEII